MIKILVVDDNEQILRLLRISLGKADFEVLSAKNGTEGLEIFRTKNPELIISDIMMPDMDGFEYCMTIREGDKNPLVPFIFMTSADSGDMEVKGYRAGADDFIQKPIERDELIERITKLLTRQKKVAALKSNSEKEEAGLTGNLSDVTLVEIIQLLSFNHRSGILDIQSGQNQKAKICFEKGQIVRIEGDYGEGNSALKDIVGIQGGSFVLDANSLVENSEKNVEGPTMSVLMEACRLHDEENQE